MLKKILFVSVIFLAGYSSSHARGEAVEVSFDGWLVSCVYSEIDEANDCFLGAQFENDEGIGAIIFTDHYLAIMHEITNLSHGVTLKVDDEEEVSSNMNTSMNVFFQNKDRMRLFLRMLSGKFLYIKISGKETVKKSLSGFAKAYNYYLVQN